MRILAFLRNFITEADNLTPDVFRLIACVGVLVFLGLAIFNWRTFEPISFGTGFGAVLVAAAGAVRINEGPKPGSTPPPAPGAVVNAEKVTVNT